MEDTLVTLEAARLLKEHGFNEYCEWGFSDDGTVIDLDMYGLHLNSNAPKDWVTRPTQSLAQKWLREKHNLHIYADYVSQGWFWDITRISDSSLSMLAQPQIGAIYKTYEEALERGLEVALKHLAI